MQRPILLFLAFQIFLFKSPTMAQPEAGRLCATEERHQWMMQNNEEYREGFFDFQTQVINKLSTPPDRSLVSTVYTVPVVVHVIHLGEAIGSGSNISDQKIFDAIEGLNERFRNQAGNSIDIEIEFCLAVRDPNNNPTGGINRVDGSSVDNYATEGIEGSGPGGADNVEVKSLSIWPHEDYYNIWVVHNINGGTAAYANYPTGNIYEGTVIESFFMSGGIKTLTHELGHAFSLRHTFQGTVNGACPVDTNCMINGDLICDTPPHRSTDCGTTNPCSNSGLWDNSRRNFMSYCSGTYLFTPGQKERMRTVATTHPVRQSLIQSLGCTPVDCSSDSLVLVELYHATDGPNWTYTATTYLGGSGGVPIPNAGNAWDFSKPVDTWHGVVLGPDRCVIRLAVNQNGLSGNLPDLNLPKLELLDIHANELSGSIPDFSNLPNLRYLRCAINDLTGPIPDFSGLPDLEIFHATFNDLNGTIPDFAGLPNLRFFGIGFNNLQGPIPDFANLPRLEHFDVTFNNLSGPIPDFSNLPNLDNFWCSENNLSASIPDFSKLPKLERFTCASNQLSGAIPDFSNLPNLEGFACQKNQLTGSIPDFSHLPSLESFQCQENQLTGLIPDFSDNCPLLTHIDLSSNQFTFEHILPSIVANQTLAIVYLYAPQDSVFKDTTIIAHPGNNLIVDLQIDENINSNFYQWYKDGIWHQDTTGNNKLEFSPFQAQDTGLYWVHITNPGALDLILESYPINIGLETASGVDQGDFEEEIRVWPNPTNSKLNIDLGQSHPQLDITIINALGKIVQRASFRHRQILEYYLDLPSGVYFVSIKSGDQFAIKKVIKN